MLSNLSLSCFYIFQMTRVPFILNCKSRGSTLFFDAKENTLSRRTKKLNGSIVTAVAASGIFFRQRPRLFRTGRAFQGGRVANAGTGSMRRNFNPRYNSSGKCEYRANVRKECAIRRTTFLESSMSFAKRKLRNGGIHWFEGKNC